MTALGMIFATIDARLDAIDRAESYERFPSGDPDVFPSLAAFDRGDEAIEQEAGTTRLAMTLTVEGYVAGIGGVETHDELLALHADAVAALCGDEGSNLGGLVENIEIAGQRIVAIAELSKERRLSFSQDFEIIYSTVRGDPASLA